MHKGIQIIEVLNRLSSNREVIEKMLREEIAVLKTIMDLYQEGQP